VETTYLEKRLRIRPLGVVSKKLIGDLKMANAILSWSFLDACRSPASVNVYNSGSDSAPGAPMRGSAWLPTNCAQINIPQSNRKSKV